jgi:hypothetical protein
VLQAGLQNETAEMKCRPGLPTQIQTRHSHRQKRNLQTGQQLHDLDQLVLLQEVLQLDLDRFHVQEVLLALWIMANESYTN